MSQSNNSANDTVLWRGALPRRAVARIGLSVVLACLVLSLGAVPATQAATLCVAPGGSGGCFATIQAAIDAASPGDTINVAASTYAENLSVFGKNLTINGAGASATIISGNNANRVWTIFSNSNMNLTNMTITYGSATGGFGGGIYIDGTMSLSGVTVTSNNAGYGSGITNFGTLTIAGSTISNNVATGSGGGIVNGKDLTITNSTISGNSATGDGGGIYHGGISLTISGSTISGNTATGNGGGIVNFGANPINIINSTISGNTATGNGGGIVNGGTLTLASSTVYGNQGALGSNIYNSGPLSAKSTIVANGNCAQFGTVTSLGGNLDSGNTCGFGTGPGDQANVDPLLGPLANNGGSTLTQALLTNSPAINAADNNGCPAADQRGTPRPQGAVCDIGAFELVDNVLPVIGACPPGGPFAFNTGVQPVGPITASDTGSGVLASASTLSGVIDTSLPGIKSLTFTAVDRVGNAASKTCQYRVTVYAAEQKVKADVSALRATVTDSDLGKKLDEALAKLTEALDPTYWRVDGNHLQPDGSKSFDKARDAVKKLSEVAKDPPYDALLRGSITALVGANRKLAQIAIVDAVSQNGKEKEIADANKELGKGDEYRDAGKFGDAVYHYRKAWEHALKA